MLLINKKGGKSGRENYEMNDGKVKERSLGRDVCVYKKYRHF